MPSIRWNRIPFRLWVSDRVCLDSLEATVYSQRFLVWESRTWGTDNRGWGDWECSREKFLTAGREAGKAGGCSAIAGSGIPYLYKEVGPGGLSSRCEARSWVIDLWQNVEAFSTYETWVFTMGQTRCWAYLRRDLIIPHSSPVGGSTCPLVSQMSNLRLWVSLILPKVPQAASGRVGIQIQATRLRNLLLSHLALQPWS